jgi:hypothetical protein
VFKSGTSNLNHPGNVSYRDLLQFNLEAFFIAQANANTKEIVRKVTIDAIKGGARFLEWNSVGCWTVMQDPAKLQVKIYHSLYQLRKSAQAKKRLQMASSSTLIFERQDGKRQKRASLNELDKHCCTRLLP